MRQSISFTARAGLTILAALVIIGVLLLADAPSPESLWQIGNRLADNPWTAVALVLLQVLLFGLALPGSLIFWLIAPFYPPVMATLLLTLGSTGGALAAHRLSGWLGRNWQPAERKHRPLLALLRENSGFMGQLAVRVLPGFPHSVVNYTAGLLHWPLPTFLAAALIGLAIKSLVYAMAVHGLVEAELENRPLDATTLLPLVVLTLLLILAMLWKRRAAGRWRGGD